MLVASRLLSFFIRETRPETTSSHRRGAGCNGRGQKQRVAREDAPPQSVRGQDSLAGHVGKPPARHQRQDTVSPARSRSAVPYRERGTNGSGWHGSEFQRPRRPEISASHGARGFPPRAPKVSAAPSTPVLSRGEGGGGKGLVPRAIHAASRRHAQPFVKVNCAALPAELL